MDSAAVVGRQELHRLAPGPQGVVVQPHGRVDAQREARQRAAVAGQRLLAALAHEAALRGVDIRRDDAVAQAGEAIELGGHELAPVPGRDEDGRPRGGPRERADRVPVQRDAVAAPRHRLAAPEHPPDLDVLLEPPRPAPVVHSAGRPLALGGGQAPPDAEPQDDAPARDLIQVADLVSQHHGLAKRRQEDRGAQAHALRHGRDVGEGRQRLEPRLGHDAVADPDGVVARPVAVPRHLPALLHGRPPGRAHDDGARREEDADAHGSGAGHR